MNQKGTYTTYIGLLAIVAIAVISFTSFTLEKSGDNIREVRVISQVHEQWTVTRIAIDNAFTDALADYAYKNIAGGNCPNMEGISEGDVTGYFDQVLNSISEKGSIDCELIGSVGDPIAGGASPYDAVLNLELRCSGKFKDDLSLTYTHPSVLTKTVTTSFSAGPPPECTVTVTDVDSGEDELSFNRSG